MKNIMKSAVFLALFAIFSLECGLPPAQTYGLYNAVLDEYKHLSPFHGFVADQNNVFRYYYDYTLDQEPMQALVHALFRVIDNGLKPHATDREIGSYLGAPEIGALLAVLEKNLDRSTGIITVAPEALKEQLVEWLKTFKMKSGIKAHQKDTFVEIIINALKEAGHWGIQGQHYPQFLVHDIFLTLLYGKVTQKIQFKDYFKQFAGLNNSQGILKPNSNDLLEKSYENPADPATMADAIIAAKDRAPFEQLSSYLVEHYEPLGYATIKKKYSGLYPPQVSYGSALLPWFANNETLKKHAKAIKVDQFAFSDCMEVAILNVISFIGYNAQKNMLEPIISFFSQFNVQTINTPAARNIWAGLVSDIPGTEYNRRVKITEINGAPIVTIEKSKDLGTGKPYTKSAENDGWYYYEIEPTLPNIVKVANKLFNLNLRNFGEFLTHFNLECGAYKGKEEEQRQSTCSITDTNKKNCTLSIDPGHGQVDPYPQSAQKTLVKEFNTISNMLSADTIKTLPILNLYNFNINYFLMNPLQLAQLPFVRHVLLIQPLQDINVKFELLSFIGPKLSQLKDTWFYDYTHKILNSLFSLHDQQTTVNTLRQWSSFASPANMFTEFKKSYEQNFEVAKTKPQILYNLLIDATQTDTPSITNFIASNFLKFDYENQYETLKRLTDDQDIYKNNPELIHELLKIWAASPKFNNAMLPLLLSPIVTLNIPSTIAQSLIIEAFTKIFSNPWSHDFIVKVSKLFENNVVKVLGVDAVKKIILEFLPKFNKKELEDEIVDIKKFNKSQYGQEISPKQNHELFVWFEQILKES